MSGSKKKQELRRYIQQKAEVDKMIRQKYRPVFEAPRSGCPHQSLTGVTPTPTPEKARYYKDLQSGETVEADVVAEIKKKVRKIVNITRPKDLSIYLLDPDQSIRNFAQARMKTLKKGRK